MQKIALTPDELTSISNNMTFNKSCYYDAIAQLFFCDDDTLNAIKLILSQKDWANKSVELLKIKLNKHIDLDAEKERLKYITDGTGQAMTYQEKIAQAATYSSAFYAYKSNAVNNKVPNAAEYPLLSASLGIDGDSLLEVAENITYAYAMWQQVGAIIETVRLQSKAAIDKAKTIDEAQAVFDAIVWP